MGQTLDQIEDEIHGSREDLRSNLEELGQRVKTAVNWREKFRANPAAVLAVAFGGGFILASVLRGSGRQGDRSDGSRRLAAPRPVPDDRKSHVLQAWDDIQSALVGVLAAKVSRTLAEVVPGFKEQLSARRGDAPRVSGTSSRQ